RQNDDNYVPYGLRPDPPPYPALQPPPAAPLTSLPTAPPPPISSPHNPFVEVNITPRSVEKPPPATPSPRKTQSGTVYEYTPAPQERQANFDHIDGDETLIAPLIELPNPGAGVNVGGEIQPPTVKVFRAWTDQDVREATKTIVRQSEDGEAFAEEMNQLFKSFGLNTIE
ncbi:hypothetical protein GBF38_022602, partial [Scomber scombrus]